MNGPIKMHRTKQIIHHNIPVQLPKCMYNLKNIHSRSTNGVVDGSHDHVGVSKNKLDIFDQVKQFLKINQCVPGMAELEAKQEQILKQLDELRNQILSIKLSLKISNNASAKSSVPTSTISTRVNSKKTNQLVDLVININPLNPPYSLEIIQKQLQDSVNLKFSAHLHSSVFSLPEDAINLQSRLVNANLKEGVPTVHLRLIWKNGYFRLFPSEHWCASCISIKPLFYKYLV
ncbi:unnamed protein product [Phaedon cochleariae]|uniref:AIMP2 thioredoxin-like domain-containing protein n=1 Tax=Phaedon cochleariae TaxID=80249 RepID=A0A9P0DUV5_PHACE|nr:unnamed protein product [Phaedon cochleariae]